MSWRQIFSLSHLLTIGSTELYHPILAVAAVHDIESTRRLDRFFLFGSVDFGQSSNHMAVDSPHAVSISSPAKISPCKPQEEAEWKWDDHRDRGSQAGSLPDDKQGVYGVVDVQYTRRPKQLQAQRTSMVAHCVL